MNPPGAVTISVGPVEIVAVLLPADTETLTNVIVPVGCVAAAVLLLMFMAGILLTVVCVLVVAVPLEAIVPVALLLIVVSLEDGPEVVIIDPVVAKDILVNVSVLVVVPMAVDLNIVVVFKSVPVAENIVVAMEVAMVPVTVVARVVDVLLLAPGSTGATIEEVLVVLSVDAGTVDPVFEITVVLTGELVTVCGIVDDVKELVAFVALIGIAESGVDPVIVEFVKVVEPDVRDIIVLLGVDMLDVVD